MYLRVNELASTTLIWRTLFDQGTQWKQATVQLGRIAQPFSVALAKINIGMFDGISAIDDVTFRNCSIPPPMAECPSGTHFHCTRTRACVENVKLCDLVDDCEDGSDEEGCCECARLKKYADFCWLHGIILKASLQIWHKTIFFCFSSDEEFC